MPERYRPNKTDIAHFGHRVAMIRQAIRPYNNFALIENSDVSFSIEKTLPKLRNQFFGSRLVFLMGSDNFENLKNWPKVETLLKHSELVVGIRAGDELMIEQWIKQLPRRPKRTHLINSFASSVSSTKIREALRCQQEADGLLCSVRRYCDRNWLYVSLS
jgi:nicotinate (nicotinamide) nucleotide adenylyltransferase